MPKGSFFSILRRESIVGIAPADKLEKLAELIRQASDFLGERPEFHRSELAGGRQIAERYPSKYGDRLRWSLHPSIYIKQVDFSGEFLLIPSVA
jgi:hypothetical protein